MERFGVDVMHELEFDLLKVFHFVRGLLPGLKMSEDMRAIGLMRDGRLIAGAIYEGFNRVNMWVHLAGEPGSRWLCRDFLYSNFKYAFGICGVQRLSGYVDASNSAARRFNEHIGFKQEAVLSGAAPDGGDVILYVMWRDDCQYLQEKSDGI